jgi:hypothetical protein
MERTLSLDFFYSRCWVKYIVVLWEECYDRDVINMLIKGKGNVVPLTKINRD